MNKTAEAIITILALVVAACVMTESITPLLYLAAACAAPIMLLACLIPVVIFIYRKFDEV